MSRKLSYFIFYVIAASCVLFLTIIGHTAVTTVEKNEPLTIAVASNFHFPLSILIEKSTYWSQQPIRLVTGSSGTLHAQLSKGAPFDLFFSADTKRPISLVDNNIASHRQTYARGKLVLYPLGPNTLLRWNDNNIIESQGKFAIANPILAPFGVAAQSFIDTLENQVSIEKQVVKGANITQAFQFVDSGNASIGLLAESVLIHASIKFKQDKYKEYWIIPNELYHPIVQQVVIAATSKQKIHAQAFIDYVVSAQSQHNLSVLGYLPLTGSEQ